jgi:hypothetical protein
MYAQLRKVEVNVGYGIYSMSKLKEMNNSVLTGLPFPAKITNSFPPYLTYRGGLYYRMDSIISVGSFISFSSTGSRISLADYSGEYRFDQAISSITTGLSIKALLFNRKPKIEIYNSFNISYSELIFIEYLEVSGLKDIKETKIDGSFCSVELGTNCYWNINRFDLGLYGGLVFDIPSNLLIIPNYRPILAGWTGPRIGIYSAYKF